MKALTIESYLESKFKYCKSRAATFITTPMKWAVASFVNNFTNEMAQILRDIDKDIFQGRTSKHRDYAWLLHGLWVSIAVF